MKITSQKFYFDFFTRIRNMGGSSFLESQKSKFIQKKGFGIKILRYRRGQAEIIGTLILLAVTVVGAIMVANFFNAGDVMEMSEGIEPIIKASTSSVSSVLLIGYDTRDNTDLSGITGLDNTGATDLCASSCTADVLPGAGGTEFIVLKIRNNGIDAVTITSVRINDVDHLQDSTTGTFNANDINFLPDDGTFMAISAVNTAGAPDPTTIVEFPTIFPEEELRLVVKLTNTFSAVIDLNVPMNVRIVTDKFDRTTFIINSGRAR